MAKRTATKRKVARHKRPAAKRAESKGPPLADMFDAMPMLDRSDLSEEQKQSILVAMNCPCCGGSGLSFTMKLKRKK